MPEIMKYNSDFTGEVSLTATVRADTARELAAEGCYDLLFFDLPGTVNSAGILRTIAQMDYIFAPVSADKAVLESTLSFLDVLQRMMLGKETSRLKGLYLFWNQVDKRETSGLYEKYETGSFVVY